MHLCGGPVASHSHPTAATEARHHRNHLNIGIFARKEFKCVTDDDKNCEISPRNGSFDKELEVAKEVSHPNIVHCFGWSFRCDSVSGCYLLSLFMELLEESLESRLQETIQDSDPFSFQDTLDILWQVADAMNYLHEKNIIYGDLKPGNILLSRLALPHSKSGKFYLVKVADFGCAQRVPPEGFAKGFSDPADANSGATVKAYFCSVGGTTHYTASEVFRHRKNRVPPKYPRMIDIYSFGVVAYQMLTGVPKLYEATLHESYVPSKLKEGVMNGQLRPDSDFKGTLARDRQSLLPLVKSCWDPKPEDRPSFSEICEKLKTHSTKHGENVMSSIEH